MLGKGSILAVFGFILVFSMYQVRMSRNVLATSDNFNIQYMETLIHETNNSAMNTAINKVWDQGVVNDSFLVRNYSCSTRVRIYPVGTDTTKIAVTSWGYIYDTATGKMQKEEKSMSAFFSRGISPLTDYFYFTNDMKGLYWVTGCTLWGPFHTNTTVKTLGSPVFYGKVTAKKGIKPDPAKPGNKAQYHDGWEIGVDMSIPTNMSHIVDAANAGNGGAPKNTKCIYDDEVAFEFLPDGKVRRWLGDVDDWDDDDEEDAWDKDDADLLVLADIAPTGAIYCKKDVRVKGELNGAVTIFTEKNIWIDDDLNYANNPLDDINSDDILGLVSKKYTFITDNKANNDGKVEIFANIVTIDGKFMAENYNKRPVSVEYFVGSQAQDQCGAHGVANWKGEVIKGFEGRLKYDPRLAAGLIYPPNYPGVPKLSLASWWE